MRDFIYTLTSSLPLLALAALAGWLLVWLPAHGAGSLANRSLKRLAFLVCAVLFFIFALAFEWHWAWPAMSAGFVVGHQASPVRLLGAALGVAASIAAFGAMLANPFDRSRGFDIQEFGEGYYRAVLATTSVLLFLASGALLLGLIID